MGIVLKGDAMKKVAAYTRKCLEITEHELQRTLQRLGEEAIIIARDRPMEESWIDHTGNLRSSIGYAIYKNGNKATESGFLPTSAPKGNGNEGQKQGRAFLESVAKGVIDTNSQSLVVVAGMNYAASVEAIDGKDVLATAELKTRAKLPEYMLKTKQRINTLIAQVR